VLFCDSVFGRVCVCVKSVCVYMCTNGSDVQECIHTRVKNTEARGETERSFSVFLPFSSIISRYLSMCARVYVGVSFRIYVDVCVF